MFQLVWFKEVLKKNCCSLLFTVACASGGHPPVDFRDPLLPQFFCSHKDLNVQRGSCNKIRDLLQARNKRVLCLAVDETVWRPSFEAVARLREGSHYSIVGGGWSAEKDCSVLAKEDGRREEDLCKLSVSVVVSRIDSNKLTVDANLCLCSKALVMGRPPPL